VSRQGSPNRYVAQRRTPQATIDLELRGVCHLPKTESTEDDRIIREGEAARRYLAKLELDMRLRNATATGERCCTKACVFPAVIDGVCRRCFLEARMDYSLLKSFFGLEYSV
jgi:hypothetical protein